MNLSNNNISAEISFFVFASSMGLLRGTYLRRWRCRGDDDDDDVVVVVKFFFVLLLTFLGSRGIVVLCCVSYAIEQKIHR